MKDCPVNAGFSHALTVLPSTKVTSRLGKVRRINFRSGPCNSNFRLAQAGTGI